MGFYNNEMPKDGVDGFTNKISNRVVKATVSDLDKSKLVEVHKFVSTDDSPSPSGNPRNLTKPKNIGGSDEEDMNNDSNNNTNNNTNNNDNNNDNNNTNNNDNNNDNNNNKSNDIYKPSDNFKESPASTPKDYLTSTSTPRSEEHTV